MSSTCNSTDHHSINCPSDLKDGCTPALLPHTSAQLSPAPQTEPDDNEKRERLLQQLNARFQPGRIRQERVRTHASIAKQRLRIRLQSHMKRALDIALAATLLTLSLPITLSLLFAGRLRRTAKLGLRCEPYFEYSFDLSPSGPGRILRMLGIGRLPALVNILRGEMSFVGPRSATPDELTPRERAVRKRAEVLPGLFCLWWLRSRTNINFETELTTDAEYVETCSVKGDLGIVLRGLPALLYGEPSTAADRNIRLLDIPIDNLTMDAALETLEERWNEAVPTRLCFVNADCANLAYRNADYLATLQTADIVLADGIGMKLAGKLLGSPIRQNVNGTDLFPRLCERLQGTGRGIYLLGARPGVAEGVRDWALANYPELTISGVRHGFFSEAEESAVIEEIANSGASILLVAFGAPRQDQWLQRCQEACGVPVAMGVGGLFDFYSGQMPRAPQWVREMGMEWLYRLVKEPGRLWKRYLVGNVVFLYRVLRTRSSGRSRANPGTDISRSHSRLFR